jgi:hypothetical protein
MTAVLTQTATAMILFHIANATEVTPDLIKAITESILALSPNAAISNIAIINGVVQVKIIEVLFERAQSICHISF